MYTYIMRINTFLNQKLLFAYTILEPFVRVDFLRPSQHFSTILGFFPRLCHAQ